MAECTGCNVSHACSGASRRQATGKRYVLTLPGLHNADMPNDAKLGLVVGVSLVILIGVVFYKKEPAPAQAAPVTTQQAAPAVPPVEESTPAEMPPTPMPDPAADPVAPAVPSVDGAKKDP